MRRLGLIILFIGLTLLLTGISTFFIENKMLKEINYFDIEDVVKNDDASLNINISDGIINDNSNIAAYEYINCINKPLDIENMPDNLKATINSLNNYFDSSKNYFAFKYKDLYTGLEIGYNEKQPIYASSLIKAPTSIYVYKEASLNRINLDEELTYTKKFQIGGTGIIKNNKFNTKYSIKNLVKYSIINSDNVAHLMLMDKYKRNNLLEFWSNKGTTSIFKKNSNWGNITANDASIYMEELFQFYQNDKVYGKELMDYFLNTKFKLIKNNEYQVAHKYGWTDKYIHDSAIIFRENPYILIILSTTGKSNYQAFFNEVSNLFDEFHTEYWKYKINVCKDINQY